MKNLNDIIPAIARHNAGRDPERLAMKYAKMAQSPFIFLQGRAVGVWKDSWC